MIRFVQRYDETFLMLCNLLNIEANNAVNRIADTCENTKAKINCRDNCYSR